MNLGQAVIEFMPTLPATAVNGLTQQATQAGTRAGRGLGEGLARETKKAAEDAGKAAANSIEQKLRQLRLPPIKLDVSPVEALREINKVEAQLKELARSAPTASVRINANAALSEMRDLKTKLSVEAGQAGNQAGKQLSDGIEKHTRGIAGRVKSAIVPGLAFLIPSSLAAGIAGIAKVGSDYEKSMNMFKAVTGATSAQMQHAGDVARQLGNDVQLPGVSAADAATAMRELAKAGLTTEESMIAAKAALQLARVGELNAADAAGIAAGAMNTFGLKAQDLTGVVDAFANVANASAVDVKDVGDSFKMAAAVFAGFQGPSIGAKNALNELNVAIGILGQQGIKGSDAGTSLKQSILQLTGPAGSTKRMMDSLYDSMFTGAEGQKLFTKSIDGSGKASKEAGQKLMEMADKTGRQGNIAYDAAGKMRPLHEIVEVLTKATAHMTEEEKNATITKIFGADATRSIIALMKGGKPAFDEMSAAIGKQGAAANLAKAQNAGMAGGFDALKGTVENAAIGIYEAIKKPITGGLFTAAEKLPAMFAVMGREGKAILPALGEIGKFIGNIIVAAAPIIGGVLVAAWIALKLAIQGIGAVLGPVNDFMQHHRTTATALLVVIGLITAAYNAQAIAAAALAAKTAIMGAVTSGVAIAQRTIAIVTNAWAAAQWLLNAAMAANPIGVVVVAIIALIAIIVLAYKHNETFRNIVQAVWSAIKIAIGAVADWFMKTVWPALKATLDALGKVFTWLWHNVISPVWTGIKVAIDIAWAVIKVIFAAIEAYVRVLAAIFTWLWKNILSPVWQGIKLVIQIAWVAIQIIFKTIEIAIKALALVFQWLWNNVITPVWNGIKAVITTVWNWLKANIFDPAINFIKTTLSAAWTFYSNLVKTVWEAIKSAVSAAWNWVKNNVLEPLMNFIKGALVTAWNVAKTGITNAWNAIKGPVEATWNFIKNNIFTPLSNFITKTIPDAFSRGVSAVGKAWDKIKEIAAVPVRFVVNTIINDGIIKGFNWIAGKVGVTPIAPIKLGFADGGVLPGYTPGKDVHRFVSPTGGRLDLSGGEAILRPELTRELGPAFINAANSAARGGQARNFTKRYLKHGRHPQFADGGILAFKDGGILGGIVGGISKAWDALTNPVDTFKNMVNGLMGGMPGGPFIKDVLGHTVSKMVDGVGAWITSKFNSSAGGMGSEGGPGNWSAMWNWVHSKFPSAQLFSGLRNTRTLSGNVSLHASGRAIDVSPMREIAIAIKNTFGKKVTELITPWPELDLWHGAFHDYSPALDRQHGVGDAGNDHVHWGMKMGGILKRFGLFDEGGWLRSGGIAVNMSRKPEAVLTAEESAGLKAMGTDRLVDLLEELIEAVRDVAPGVGQHIRGSGKRLVTQARGV